MPYVSCDECGKETNELMFCNRCHQEKKDIITDLEETIKTLQEELEKGGK